MRVALIHYWLTSMRGGEKVLEALCSLYPNADIYTHVYVPENISDTIREHKVYSTFIQKLPLARKYYTHYLPLMPLALEQLDLRAYDLVISSESGPAKGVLTKAETPHLCYCHTPMRYLWDFYQDYLQEVSPVTRLGMRLLTHRLRIWDALSAQRVDAFAANSQNVARRIQKHYRRDSTVIYPPVDIKTFAPQTDAYPESSGEYLCLGQLVGYKRVDLAVAAFTRLNKPLAIIGQGPEYEKLRKMAGPTIRFYGRLDTTKEIVDKIQRCRAVIFPGEEDFGIVPVEAMAAGRPVIAFGKGGALETVISGKTGILFQEQTPKSLMAAVQAFEADESSFAPSLLTEHAQQFSQERFATAFQAFADQALASW